MKNEQLSNDLPLYIILHVDDDLAVRYAVPIGALWRTGVGSKNSCTSSPFDNTLPDSKACYIVCSGTRRRIVSTRAGSYDVWWSGTTVWLSVDICGVVLKQGLVARCRTLRWPTLCGESTSERPSDNENSSMHCKVILPHWSHCDSGTLLFCISVEIADLERGMLQVQICDLQC